MKTTTETREFEIEFNDVVFESTYNGISAVPMLEHFLSSALIRVEIESLQKGYAQGYDDMKNIVKEELAKLKSSKIQSEEKKV